MNESQVARFVLGHKTFYIHSTWREDSFDVLITDGKHAWSDLVSSSDIDNLKPDGMECTKFIALCKQALTKQDIEKRKFSYSISMMRDDGSVIKLLWKIRVLELTNSNDMSFSIRCHCILERQKDARSSIQGVIDYLVKTNSNLKASNDDFQKMNLLLTKQRTDNFKQLNNIIEEKSKLESELYSKFELVLNEKKKKIRQLKDQLLIHSTKPILPPTQSPSLPLDVSSPTLSKSSQSPTSSSKDWSSPTLELLNDVKFDFKSPIRKRMKRSADDIESP